ncbi:MAG TPA: basic amino acid ABC transporter substrate-binding protein [Thermoleophilia bacterium]|nr:basic amino acid ABC transporter substrate-binding protein [Thermoleophilia bacterium]
MKRSWLIVLMLLVVALAVLPLTAGCGGDKETTTTTAAAAGDPVAAADAAIAAITKSDAIEMPPTLEAGKLQAGSDTSFAPFEFSDEKGGYIGFDVDLVTAIAKKIGLEAAVVATAWDGIIPNLVADRYDIIMSAMTITEERQQQIDFTDGYIDTNLAITTKVDAPIADAAGLEGKIVGVQVDTTGQFEVEKVAGVKEIKKYENSIAAIQDLLAGRIDAVVNDSPVNAYYTRDKPEFGNTGKIGSDDKYGYGIKKESSVLRDAMNAALAELKADGTYDLIYAKWFGGDK